MQKVKKMALKYITQFGYLKVDEPIPDTKEKWEKFRKVLEKNNLKLLYWAGAMGASEPLMYTIKFKDIKDWETAGPEMYEANPLKNTRTIFGWTFD